MPGAPCLVHGICAWDQQQVTTTLNPNLHGTPIRNVPSHLCNLFEEQDAACFAARTCSFLVTLANSYACILKSTDACLLRRAVVQPHLQTI